MTHSVELQRAVSLEMYWTRTDGFNTPGNWSSEILAVRNGDVSTVERMVMSPGWVATPPRHLSVRRVPWCSECVFVWRAAPLPPLGW